MKREVQAADIGTYRSSGVVRSPLLSSELTPVFAI
jgi:hypothetical protein